VTVQFASELEIESILSGFEKLVIVKPFLSPMDCLIVKNIIFCTRALVRRTPKDTVRMGVFGVKVVIEVSIITIQGMDVIIPMNRHGRGVSD